MAISKSHVNDPIAIIGSACRFPGGSTSPSKLWELLEKPRDVLQEFDPERLRLSRFYDKDGDVHGATNVQNKSYLLTEDTRLFDASFFGINPLEAEGVDPQQRTLLEVMYEAFESAGRSLQDMQGSLTSVHVGVMNADYNDIQLRDPETLLKYNATGVSRSIISNRISYVFDLKGPSATIDTACSSSLVALHYAIQGLKMGDSTAALVGGVNLIFDPTMYIVESKLHMLSPDSRSRMWSSDANGYARGEGICAIYLKPLSLALADGDHIEGLIRSTGVNSDGKSQGITMPSASAQAALIRRTYEAAGLDPVKDRCQYFECHGTGTLAGDPVEARAISEALLPQDGESDPAASPLYVGSIKTIIGHTEGCAGLAGVMKALLAIKNRTIPPNMHFKELNPEIAPFYGRMRILTSALPWPEVPGDQPLRASVNSFGFGGTNAHAIIEEYKSPDARGTSDAYRNITGPFVFSAATGRSLVENVNATIQYLDHTPCISLGDLAWTLQRRQTPQQSKVVFSGESSGTLLAKMQQFVDAHTNFKMGEEIGMQTDPLDHGKVPRILGVFTGQGAQWPAMGRELIQSAETFRKSMEYSDRVLQALPDAPDWSLIDEMMADAPRSRVGQAIISQPLCTAVQIALIDMLTASGIRFNSVVGHSSGEIAAAFASGILTHTGAVQIAYYRGFHAKLAQGLGEKKGGMIAVGISYDEAQEFCQLPNYRGRLAVAASNSPRSVTLSGDIDAVHESKVHFESLNTFARVLQVDTAYHSHHMVPCAGPYLQSLLACQVEVRRPENDCAWISSVFGDISMLDSNLDSLKGSYWVKNMTQTVLFSQAVTSAVSNVEPFDLAIEVGPHPALKSPAEQSMKAVLGNAPIYTGTLVRGAHDTLALANTIGTLWAHLGPSSLDFRGYLRALAGLSAPESQILKGLPAYAWDHAKVYWRESRISRRYRLGNTGGHPLLGRRSPEDNTQEMRWRNVLRQSDLPWLRGHQVLNEVLLPGASYAVLAVEAAHQLGQSLGRQIQLIELRDVNILRPVVVPDTYEGIETIFSLRITESKGDAVEAEFCSFSCSDETSGAVNLTCSGHVVVHLDATSIQGLPEREAKPADLLTVSPDLVYGYFEKIGLNYSGPFKRLAGIERSRRYATASATWEPDELADFTIHPALLDNLFQLLSIAQSHPSTDVVTGAQLPVHIERVLFDVRSSTGLGGTSPTLTLDSYVTHQSKSLVLGDIHAYDEFGRAYLQVEGLMCKTANAREAATDRQMFAETVWKHDVSHGICDMPRSFETETANTKLVESIDRLCMYYMRSVIEEMRDVDLRSLSWFHQKMLEAFKLRVEAARENRLPLVTPECLNDGPDVVEQILDRYPGQIDLLLAHAVGMNLPAVLRGDVQLLEVMLTDGMLDRFYMEGAGMSTINEGIKDVLEQLTHKFPRMNILEVGAGTGATAWSILNAIGSAYESYTYTDISTGFFERAAEKFATFADKMIFKPLNIERSVVQQGFVEHSYDVVVASNVLHATRSMAQTLTHARELLKPGGYLVLLETTGAEVLRLNFIMGGLPGWWLGADDGRPSFPGLTPSQWDDLLRETGYSGCDNVFPDLEDERKHCNSLIVSQAVDETVLQLREPLRAASTLPQEDVVVVGGTSLLIKRTFQELKKLLGVCTANWRFISSLDSIDANKLTPNQNVIFLGELEKPLFSTRLDDERIQKLQCLLMNSRNIVWVTKYRHSQSPESNMFSGIARVLYQELPHVRMQLLDLESSVSMYQEVARIIGEAFLRLRISSIQQHSLTSALWSHELEVTIKDDKMLVPRVMPLDDLNRRFNSASRIISEHDVPSNLELAVLPGDSTLTLSKGNTSDLVEQEDGLVQVQHSLVLSHNEQNSLYLHYGNAPQSGSAHMAVNSSLTSTLVQADTVVPMSRNASKPQFLKLIMAMMAARTIAQTYSCGMILVLEADDQLASAISLAFRITGHEAIFATSQQMGKEGRLFLHPTSTLRAIKATLPQNVAVVLDCSPLASEFGVLRRAYEVVCLERCITPHCNPESLRQILSQIDAAKLDTNLSSDSGSLTFKATQLAGAARSLLSNGSIVDWEMSEPVELTVLPYDPRRLFSANKTYLMVGMSGGLGISICKFMIESGARHMVITSRNPQVDAQWLHESSLQGAEVRIEAMDVADKDSVSGIADRIRAEMPPLGGICNAAMVLSDGLFLDMDAKQFNCTIGPKVDGTRNLHEVFSGDHLDFFVMFSSIAAIIGNAGQANYHVANMFMTGLAAKRREAGLAASVMHIGLVADVGYVTRQSRTVDDYVRNLLLLPLSETEVHHAFTEAVAASPHDSDRQHEIILGIEPIKEPLDVERRPKWASTALFAHFEPCSNVISKTVKKSQGTKKNLLQVILAEDQREAAVSSVEEALCTKLEAMMRMPEGSIKGRMPIIDLGIDSLIAIEIRTWFKKELDTDVSVIKILGGDTVSQICTAAVVSIRLERNAPSEDAEALADSSQNPEEDSTNTSITDMEEQLDHENDKSAEKPSTSTSSESISVPKERAPEMPEAKVVREEAMSDAQSRIWFLTRHLESDTSYNMVFRYKFSGTLSMSRFRYALSTVTQHHGILRTCFYDRDTDGQPMQGVLSHSMSSLQQVQSLEEDSAEQEFAKLQNHAWNLERGETLRVVIVSKENEHTILIGYHHIIMDSSSYGTFLQDLSAAYVLKLVPDPTKSYIDYTLKKVATSDFNARISYWEHELEGVPTDAMPLLPVSQLRSRPSSQSNDVSHAHVEIKAASVEAIRRICQRLRVTMFHFHVAAFQTLLARSLDLQEICLGMTDANREDESFARTLGFYMNMLPLRLRSTKEAEFGAIAKATSNKVLAALSNRVSFDEILNRLNANRASSHTPVFQAVINYRVGDVWTIPMGESQMILQAVEDAQNPYDISLGVLETGSGSAIIEFTCNADLYNDAAADEILKSYLYLIDQVVECPDMKMEQLKLGTAEDIETALKTGAGLEVSSKWMATLTETFTENVRRYPGQVAVRDHLAQLTYSELDRRVRALAGTLLRSECGFQSRIAVLCEPSVDFVTCMLAIFFIGAVYVPLDLSLPLSRHRAIVEHCSPALVLYHAATVDHFQELRSESQDTCNGFAVQNGTSESVHVTCNATADMPAMVLYTSGSTGKPKGIVLSQGNFVHFLSGKDYVLNMGREVVLQQSSMGFDMSIVQVFCALGKGGRLVIAPQGSRRDPMELTELLVNEKISLTIATPSEYIAWGQLGSDRLSENDSWTNACMGGEAVTPQLKRMFSRLGLPSITLTNWYGPTETTAAATWEGISLDADQVPYSVGKPLPNTSICIVDPAGNPLPVGYSGEICVVGGGVAAGYLDMSEQTDAKFKQQMFGTDSRGYRTGDKGRILADGTVLLYGRIEGDSQIKLRGLRMELDEIERCLMQSAKGLLSTVAVTPHDDLLVAFGVVATGATASEDELRQVLGDMSLPQYMIPARIITIESMPRSSTGKCDRKKVQELAASAVKRRQTAKDGLKIREAELLLLWEGILPSSGQRLGPESDFFVCGGNSLLLMRLQKAIRDSMGVTVSTRDLYGSSTLREMAASVSSVRDEIPAEDPIEWTLETTVAQGELVAKTRSRQPKTDGIRVLMTGSPSFLGHATLERLAASERVDSIHCITVNPQDRSKVAATSSKVRIYEGSLNSATLGLTPEDISMFETSIDVMIHAGASGHCLNRYSSLRTPNVQATRFLAELASRSAIPVLYLSSNRVVLLSGSNAPGPMSMSAFSPKTDGSEGFTASKWASEQILQKMASQSPMAVSIHRPCVVVGSQAPASDALNAILRYSIDMRAVPRFDNAEGYLDFKPVEEVARDISDAAINLAQRKITQSEVTFTHHSGGTAIPVHDFARHMTQLYGTEFEELPMDCWIERALVRGIDPLITAYLNDIIEKGGRIAFPYMGRL